MKPFNLCLFILLLCLLPERPAHGQLQIDSLFQWRGYLHPGQCRLRIYETNRDEERTHTIVLQELNESRGPLIHEDLTYLVEEISRSFNLDATRIYWVIHWGGFTFSENSSSKELFLRATFRRSESGRLGAPQWRVLRREEVEELTDRRFR